MSRGTKDIRFTSSSPAVEQAIEILKYLASDVQLKANLTNIAKAVGIYKSKAQNILDALQTGLFVSKDEESKTYSLGVGVIPVGQRALQNLNYEAVAKPFLKKLAQETKCVVLFGLITGKNLLIIEKETSGQEIDSRVQVGYNPPLFYRGHGKAILAALPKNEKKRLLSGKDFFYNENDKVVSNSKLFKEIDKVKKQGYVIESGKASSNVKLISAAILGQNEYPIGALIIVGVMGKREATKNSNKVLETTRSLSKVLWVNRKNKVSC